MGPDTQTAQPGWVLRHPRILGALLLLALHAAFLPLGGAYIGVKPEAGAYLLGVTQIAYAVPALVLLMKLGRVEIAKGMLFAALATFVVNAAGCAAFLWMLSGIEG